MSLQQSKTFFKNLKETCKKIDSNVGEIKKKLNETPEDAAYAAAKCLTNIQDKIQKLQTESSELKYRLEPNLTHSTDFIQHFKELIADTEVSVTNLENHLKQYGYTPLPPVRSKSPEKCDSSPVKNKCIQDTEDLSKTPNLMDYGISSQEYSTFVPNHKERKSSFEDLVVPPMIQFKNHTQDKETSGSTPTLVIDIIHHTEEETPPLPESVRTVAPFPTTPKLEL